jgi:hypothetical protein
MSLARELSNNEDLERNILHGLSCEWERAIWVLPSRQASEMRLPLFRLQGWKDRWGTWSGSNREITLSLDLVLNHSWDAVREVLLHEMAHQFTEEVLLGGDESPHGPAFHKACLLLRANPRASGKYPPLDERAFRADGGSPPRDRILRKIRKLLALAASGNRHEADSAMAKAHEFMAKYNLELLEGPEKDRDFDSVFVGRPALRHLSGDYALAHLLQDFYFVRGIWVPAYVPEKKKMGRVLEVSGTIPNLRIAAYVHEFVSRFIHAQWTEYRSGKDLKSRRLTDFASGIIAGFRSKLQNRSPRLTAISGAVVKIEDPLLRKYFRHRYPHTSKVARGGSRTDRSVWQDGVRAGRTLVIFQGITVAENHGRLIERK